MCWVELARSPDFSGPGLTVFFETKPKLRFGLFRSHSPTKYTKLIHIIWGLEIGVKGNWIFLMKLLVKQQQHLYPMPSVWNLHKISHFQLWIIKKRCTWTEKDWRTEDWKTENFRDWGFSPCAGLGGLRTGLNRANPSVGWGNWILTMFFGPYSVIAHSSWLWSGPHLCWSCSPSSSPLIRHQTSWMDLQGKGRCT